ncbi:hypothetical protein K474DRAFT_1652816 [Panus rudis PR-1116 ss-1]|nr:hypothetical protein K474DRAFT_1652816 [Panus rudis PR-1116 ss-1]
MTTRYIPHIIYTTALISVSTHALYQRKKHEDERLHTEAHISLLDSLITRLRAGETIPEKEFTLLDKFTRDPEVDRAAARGLEAKEEMGWREVLFGRKRSEEDAAGVRKRQEEWDRKDLEKVQQEMEGRRS